MASMEITNVTASASLWESGQRASLSLTLKNTSGVKFTDMVLSIIVDSRSFTGGASGRNITLDYILGTAPLSGAEVNWASGKSKTFSSSFTITDEIAGYFRDYPSVRAVPLRLYYHALNENIGAVIDIPGQMVLNRFFAPQITRFSLQRAEDGAPNDEGESLLASVQLSASDASCADFLRAKLHYAPDARADEQSPCIDLSGDIPALLAGVVNSASLVPGEYSNGSAWDFLLIFGDGYESTSVRLNVGRAFANMHLSGAESGGVCFGGFSSSAEGDPKLESHYPAHLYGGIARIGDGWTELAPLAGSTPAEYGGGILRCRKIEGKCIIAGSLLVKPGSTTRVLAQLPDGYTPATGVFSINACSGSRVARIAVGGANEENAGKLALSWVKSLLDGTDYTEAAIWVQCSIEYWVE